MSWVTVSCASWLDFGYNEPEHPATPPPPDPVRTLDKWVEYKERFIGDVKFHYGEDGEMGHTEHIRYKFYDRVTRYFVMTHYRGFVTHGMCPYTECVRDEITKEQYDWASQYVTEPDGVLKFK